MSDRAPRPARDGIVGRWIRCALLGLVLLVPIRAMAPEDAIAQEGAPPAAEGGPPAQPWLNLRETELIDQDGDGRTDALRVFGYWASPAGDTLMIYDHDGDMGSIPDYRVAANMTNSTWVFNVASSDQARLIIRFATEGADVAAYLWDDFDGDGRVAYEVRGTEVVVTESPYWKMKLWARGGWLRPDGTLSGDLHMLFDGCGDCNLTAAGSGYPAPVAARMPVDGVPDFRIDMTDDDDDGVPEYLVWRMLADVPVAMYGIARFAINGNEGRVRPRAPEQYLFWPLLAGEPPSSNYFDLYPMIPFSVDDARLDQVRLPGYPIEHGFHINSYAYAPEGEPEVYANFENPMAYYDAAQDRDGFPELMVRIGYGRAHDPLMAFGRPNVPITDVRYSWNIENEKGLIWTNKVHLAGRYEIEERSTLAGNEVLTVPHAELPGWVTAREWDATTFVSVELDGAANGSEGIYGFNTGGPEYFAGLETESPFAVMTGGEAGLRGDWATRPGRPELYLDPVDRQFHLLRPDGGVWNVDDVREVRYLNESGGEMVDGWQVRENGQVVAELRRLAAGLLYSDDQETLFRSGAPSAPLLQTMPPTDHATWATLREQTENAPPAFAPGDLRAMFDQFEGEVVPIAAAAAGEIRRVGDGFRLSVDADGAPTREALARLTGAEPTAGRQVVAFTEGRWTVEPATFANPTVDVTATAPQALAGTTASVRVANAGTVDVGDAYVRVDAVAPDGTRALLDRREVTVPGKGEEAFEVGWIPTSGGAWSLEATVFRVAHDPAAEARRGADVALATHTATLDVAAPPALPTAEVATAGWRGELTTRLAVLLALVTMAGAGIALALRGAGATA